ncbi:hypothetical protein AKG98_3831 [Moritella sp. JT01]|uniref:hypothetical protein n=1 Tax=Moritella sp. JT01 TaxID=756698 RepID=UPI0007979CAD|nr:hypothetical protein [Moritella sp. JT01]KXO12636.1 hypothetical protein AKG98_3831 [Moritella sp. JT01]
MNNEHDVIDNLEELERFLLNIENGGLGLQGVAGIGMATNTKDGRHFVAVFDDNQNLLLARYVTEDVYENGKEMVRNGVQTKH